MAPHPVLTNRYAAPEERPVYVKQLFDHAAQHYDTIVGWGFWGTGNLYRKTAQSRHGLKPGGRVLILEATRPSGKIGSWLFKLYFGIVYPFLARLLTRSRKAEEMMVYFWETMDTCVRPESVVAAFKAAGFSEAKRHPLMGIFSEYSAIKPSADGTD